MKLTSIKQLKEMEGEPQVQVPGYGKLLPSQIKRKVQDMVADIASEANKDQPDWKQLEFMMKKDTLHAFIETLKKHYKEMN